MIQTKILLFALLTLSIGSIYPYYLSMHNRSLLGAFSGLMLWFAVKSLQLFPSIVTDGGTQYIVMIFALAIDAAILQATYSISGGLQHWIWLGAGLIGPLLALRVAKRIGVIKPEHVIVQAQLASSNSAEHPRSIARTVFQTQNSGVAEHPRSAVQSSSVLDLITKTPVSTLLIAQPGTGKTMTASSMGRRWVQQGHHVYYIDSKADEKEIRLWDDACSDRYQFDGTLLLDPNDECARLLEAFEAFEAFRLHHLGDGKQTICILDELPAVMAVFKTYKPNPNAVLNFINRIVNRLPSRNCHILAVTQNPSCADTLPTGTLGTLKKIIITKAGSEAELEEWKGLTVMKPIDLSGVSSAIRNSPVDRGCYYSVVQKWLPMESLIREGDYNRDNLSGGGDYQNLNQRECATSVTAAFSPPTLPPLDNLVLEYFNAANPDRAKSVKNLRDSSRLRDRATDVELMDALDRLTANGQLLRMPDGWILPSWQDLN